MAEKQQQFSKPTQETRANDNPYLNLRSRQGKDMPIRMGCPIQSVVIGNILYIGGGGTSNDEDRGTVMKFDILQNQWSTIPQYTTKYFAMASACERLVLIGGIDLDSGKRVKKVAVLYLDKKWETHPYPETPTARDCSTAVSVNRSGIDIIIVAGGRDDQRKHTSTVEILDSKAKVWYEADSLPTPRDSLGAAIISNTLYVLGGYDDVGSTKKVLAVNVDELIGNAREKVASVQSPRAWKIVDDTLPVTLSTPLSFGGDLLSIGGRDDYNKSSSSIYLYKPNDESSKWKKLDKEMPTSRYQCACSVLPNGEEVIVAGGSADGFLNTVDILQLQQVCD